MPISLRRRAMNVSDGLDDKILTLLITSTQFCKSILPQTKQEHFNVPYAKRIVKWVREYYRTYERAPGSHIQDIFEASKHNLRDGEANIIEAYLSTLSDQYESSAETNIEYMVDKTVRFYKKQGLHFLKNQLEALLIDDQVEEADSLALGYKELIRSSDDSWVNPFDENYVNETMDDFSTNSDIVLTMPGDLGEMLGPIELQQLIGVMGPMKRGKTNWLIEFAVRFLFNRVNTAFISLEMKNKTIAKRIWRRLGPFTEGGGSLIYPALDCANNQMGDCNLAVRTNNISLVDDDGRYPRFDPNSPYKTCTVCRNRRSKRFIPATWFEVVNCSSFSPGSVIRKTKGIRVMHGNKLRMKSFPAYSANVSALRASLNELEHVHNFIPRAIIIDYADILAPENSKITGRDRIDETWKALKNLADVRKCVVITATQSNRKSIDKRSVAQTDTGEDIRKIAHVDAMITLNQTRAEKRRKIMRVGLCAHRHKDFNEFDHCLVLQQISAGQVFLDSQKLPSQNVADDDSDEESDDE